PRWTSPRGIPALAADLAGAVDGRTRGGEWGVMVVSLTRGDTLFQRNASTMLKPASTMKMYSAAVALDRFGPEHTFKTAVLRDGDIQDDGTLTGNLYLRGDADPTLGSPRFWQGQNPLDLLAQRVAAAGIKRVRGAVIADATAFDDKPIPDGWKTSYLGAAYAARVSALTLAENLVWVAVRPEGGKAVVTLEPATSTLPVRSAVALVNGSGGRISAARGSDGVIHVRGAIGRRSPPRKWSLVVEDPAIYAGGALHAALQKAGVAVEGGTRLGPTPEKTTHIASVASPPLARIVTEMNRESINVYAELLYRAAARDDTSGRGANAQSALAHLRRFFRDEIKGDPNGVNVQDGSGLSELDFVTARSMVQLLHHAHRAPWGPTFHASLPASGESGTLARRNRGTPAAGNLHAKTGTTNTVVSLGGYVTAKNGEVLAFAFMFNGGDRGNARAAMDQMGATLAEWVRE
ncbi:MAG TPA: D-alanyl-D-alanine carboxypeptidase/D-alanyl-D-alanine-endopeptidase, partial [Gemmatimonadaceae bacterium]|nr:D-alanyl-D-alanine carboxypeptidase/D-alanyl-D-alanine-endopeptidase [Gemmatimonadaceae bacterium]